jgi:thiol-disulfide isomerase/thioredoxin
MRYLVLIVLLSVFSCKNEKGNETVAEPLALASQIVPLEVYNYNELEPFLNRNDDKIYVVNFWATWCAPCVKELPYYEKLKANYANKNVEVILVSLDFPRQYDSKLKPFISEKNLKSKVVALNDTDSNRWIPLVSEDWTGAIPATLIYNKDKREFYEQSFEYEELETKVKQFLN